MIMLSLTQADALPAALACVDFCVVALPALLDAGEEETAFAEPGVLATAAAAISQDGVLSTVASAGLGAASLVGGLLVGGDEPAPPRQPSLADSVDSAGPRAVEQPDGSLL